MDSQRQLRVAIVGAGPAGFFATADLLKRADLDAHVDMFDRLPTPYGLVRNGVAPDHQSIKSIVGRYAKDAEGGGVRFRLFGNVEVGKDVTLEELRRRYDAVILAFGAQNNRRMGVPGEELPGVHAASVFVGWYNGHPDCAECRYHLDRERAVVVGVGNVALDVARIIAKSPEELAKTDISDNALQTLRSHSIREIVLVGRQGPAQASYTPVELGELADLPGWDLVVAREDRVLDPVTERQLADGTLEPRVRKNIELIEKRAKLEPTPGNKVIRLRFHLSPEEVLGEERVRALRFRVNRMVERDGRAVVEPTDRRVELPADCVFRAIGYRVMPVPGVPFDEKTSTVPHARGQVIDAEGRPVPGLFVTGWAKRGPTGVIGTNKPDAVETVGALLAARARGELPAPASAEDLTGLLASRGIQFVSYSDWKLLDQLEVATGKAEGRPRRKFTDLPSMLQALAKAKMNSVPQEPLSSTPG